MVINMASFYFPHLLPVKQKKTDSLVKCNQFRVIFKQTTYSYKKNVIVQIIHHVQIRLDKKNMKMQECEVCKPL